MLCRYTGAESRAGPAEEGVYPGGGPHGLYPQLRHQVLAQEDARAKDKIEWV